MDIDKLPSGGPAYGDYDDDPPRNPYTGSYPVPVVVVEDDGSVSPETVVWLNYGFLAAALGELGSGAQKPLAPGPQKLELSACNSQR